MRRFLPPALCGVALLASAACQDDPIRGDTLDAGGTWEVEVTSTDGPPDGCVFDDGAVAGVPRVGGLAELAASGHAIVVEQSEDQITMVPIEYRRGNVAHHWTLDGVVEGRKIEATLTHEISVTQEGLVSTQAGVETLFGAVASARSFEATGNGVHFGPDPSLPSEERCSKEPVAAYRVRIEPSPLPDAS